AKRKQVNKEELRADINSFRELANMSARTAVAKHSWKKLRGQICAKAALTALSYGVSGTLISGILGPRFSYPIIGGVIAAVGTVLGFNVVKTTMKLVNLKSGGKKTEGISISEIEGKFQSKASSTDDDLT
ncbi:MAG: hypothetical protein KDA84_09670, partial [Planctomycetaceae bacterium]|nr:hypothetical protein [Planctomycetaceae bacterium]